MLQVEKQLTQKFELVTREYLEADIFRSLERRRLPDYAPFLDDAGAHNWLALEASGQFAAVSGLTEFLEKSLPYLAEHFIPEFNLVSVGVGGGSKDRVLLESLMRIGSPSYYSIDVSGAMIDAALNTLADVPVAKTGLVAFFEDLPITKRLWCRPALLCLLGNTLSTYPADFVLSTVRAELEPHDRFLFDARLRATGNSELADAFAAPASVRFQLAPLISRGLEPDAVKFAVHIVDSESPAGNVRRIDRAIRILRETGVTFGPGSIRFLPGETVRLGSTFQYTLEQVRQLIERNRLALVEQHLAPEGDRAVFMVRRPRKQKHSLL